MYYYLSCLDTQSFLRISIPDVVFPYIETSAGISDMQEDKGGIR